MGKKVIGVHAGHGMPGGLGCGAIGIRDESREARNIKNLLLDKMDKEGVYWSDFTYTENARASEILDAIIREINKENPEISISIHLNASANSSAHGIEALYYPGDSAGKKLCETFCAIASGKTGMTNRGERANSKLAVLNRTKCTSVIFECGFVTSSRDMELYRAELFADAIMESLKECGYVSKKTTPTYYEKTIKILAGSKEEAENIIKTALSKFGLKM